MSEKTLVGQAEPPKGGLFEKLYAAGKEVVDQLNKPFVRKALKRKLESAYDDACKKGSDAEAELNKERQNLTGYDVNKVLRLRETMCEADIIKTDLMEEYYTMFGVEMKINDEE